MALVALALGLAATGCGHPATREECDELFAKNAELELRGRNITDADVIKDKISQARTAEGESFATHCLGRRVTASALACVRKATTSAELDRCL